MRVAIIPGAIGTLTNAHYWDYGPTLAANGGTLNRDRIALGAGHTLMVWASATGVSAGLVGVEEDV